MIDPVTGGLSAAAGGYTPSSLRGRSHTAEAEPDFRDAVQVFLAHKRQLAHWSAYWQFGTDALSILGNREVGNAIEAKGGRAAVTVLRKWVDSFLQGGFRDAAANLDSEKTANRMADRAATVLLIGKMSTLMIQSTQLAAAAAQMPMHSYLLRLGKLLTGNLNWSDAMRSPFIQRRMEQMPPIVRQALRGLSGSKPNHIKYAVSRLGRSLPGADALFTAGTFAILLDYHRTLGRKKKGFSGDRLEYYAQMEASRATERVAQPTRPGTRSIYEVSRTGAASRVMWAFASEARNKIALAAWSTVMFKQDPARFFRTAFVVWGVGGAMSQIIRNWWRDLGDDDDEEVFDEKNWSAERLALATIGGPLNGIPFFGGMLESVAGRFAGVPIPEGDIFSGVSRAATAVTRVVSGKSVEEDEPTEALLKDVRAVLSGLGLLNDTVAGLAAAGNALFDAGRIIDSLSNDAGEQALLQKARESRAEKVEKAAEEDAKPPEQKAAEAREKAQAKEAERRSLTARFTGQGPNYTGLDPDAALIQELKDLRRELKEPEEDIPEWEQEIKAEKLRADRLKELYRLRAKADAKRLETHTQ